MLDCFRQHYMIVRLSSVWGKTMWSALAMNYRLYNVSLCYNYEDIWFTRELSKKGNATDTLVCCMRFIGIQDLTLKFCDVNLLWRLLLFCYSNFLIFHMSCYMCARTLRVNGNSCGLSLQKQNNWQSRRHRIDMSVNRQIVLSLPAWLNVGTILQEEKGGRLFFLFFSWCNKTSMNDMSKKRHTVFIVVQ